MVNDKNERMVREKTIRFNIMILALRREGGMEILNVWDENL